MIRNMRLGLYVMLQSIAIGLIVILIGVRWGMLAIILGGFAVAMTNIFVARRLTRDLQILGVMLNASAVVIFGVVGARSCLEARQLWALPILAIIHSSVILWFGLKARRACQNLPEGWNTPIQQLTPPFVCHRATVLRIHILVIQRLPDGTVVGQHNSGADEDLR